MPATGGAGATGGASATRAERATQGASGSGPGGALFASRDVAQILGISRRQLQYWARTDLVVPSERTAGGHPRYTFRDLVALKAARRLLDAGVSVQRLRRSIGALRRLLPTVERPLEELVLVATGDVVLALHQGSAFEAVSGQEWVFEVACFQREVAEFQHRSGCSTRGAGGKAGREEARARSG